MNKEDFESLSRGLEQAVEMKRNKSPIEEIIDVLDSLKGDCFSDDKAGMAADLMVSVTVEKLREINKTHVLVPREPTKEMLDEVCSTEIRYPILRADDETMTDTYKAMLSAHETQGGE